MLGTLGGIRLFQSALPLRGATGIPRGQEYARIRISIRAPLAGSDARTACHRQPCSGYFNPRSPCGERQADNAASQEPFDFNPRSPCGERLHLARHRLDARDFNPRSPCGERRRTAIELPKNKRFQSALPLRGATTRRRREPPTPEQFQSALPLRGATAIFCSITLLSAKYCSFKDRRRKFIRQIPQNSSRTRYNVVRTSLVEHDRLWFATS